MALMNNTNPIRPMLATDVAKVVSIEEQSFPNPWTEGIIRDCLRVGYPSYVVEDQNHIIGYTIFSIAANECHILNLCVHAKHQGQGFGRQLLGFVIDQAKTAASECIFLEVRASNEAAIKLYERAHFKKMGIRQHYYQTPEGLEDAIVYQLIL